MDISGNIQSKENSLIVDGKSSILGGALNFNLKNDDLMQT
jgi:hypothetical protein